MQTNARRILANRMVKRLFQSSFTGVHESVRNSMLGEGYMEQYLKDRTSEGVSALKGCESSI